jgi:hypothetical protein
MPGKAKRILITISGAMAVLLGMALALSGIFTLSLYMKDSDSEGFQMSEPYEIRSGSCAFSMAILPNKAPYSDIRTKWEIDGLDPDKELFAGITNYTDTTNYLQQFEFEAVSYWEWNTNPYSTYLNIDGTNVM